MMNADQIKEEIATICRKIKYGFAKQAAVRVKYENRLAELRKQLEAMRVSS
jgi:hypothetical protein